MTQVSSRMSRLWPAVFGVAFLSSPVLAQGPGQVAAAGPQGPRKAVTAGLVTEQAGRPQVFSLEAGNGRVLTLPGPASNVFVADPKVAEVRPASVNSLFVFGVSAGRTTVAAMDADGHAVAQFEVSVRPSTFVATEVESIVARLVPNGRVKVVAQPRGVMLTGSVQSPAEAARVVAIVQGYMPEKSTVENQMSVRASIQVNMRVRIVEMQRSTTRALGIDWQALGSVGKFAVGLGTANGLGIGSAIAGRLAFGVKDANGIIDSLAQDNLVRVLAEPNITVMSGQPGSFLAGGEFPIPIAQSNDSGSSGGGVTRTIVFKKYGVSLNVVPTVLNDGRINLHIAPEVSQLSDQGAVKLSNTDGTQTLSIPGLLVRRAETSVELGSGQSFAIAGLLADNITQSTSGLAFLGDLPVLGALFRSSAYQRQETELVILVTPYVVRAVDDQASLKTPNDRFTPPNDLERILLLRQVGAQPASVQARIPGSAGFVVQ